MGHLNEKFNQITDYINGILNDHQGVGLSVTIVKDSDIIYSKGFGYSQIQPLNQPRK